MSNSFFFQIIEFEYSFHFSDNLLEKIKNSLVADNGPNFSKKRKIGNNVTPKISKRMKIDVPVEEPNDWKIEDQDFPMLSPEQFIDDE